MVVLHLFSEAMDVIEPGQEIGVTVAQFAGSASSRSVTQQIPLNLIARSIARGSIKVVRQ
jgi:hypothetical protein